MKSVIFTEDQLHNLDDIRHKLFEDEQDPRSTSYKRILNRPKINWFIILLYIVIPVLILTGIIFLLLNLGLSVTLTIIIPVVLFLIYVALILKRAIICIVRIYQRYAPDSIRNKCRFEPSCSEYMILSIKKYGLIKGIIKGIHRLKRCNINHGGFDYP